VILLLITRKMKSLRAHCFDWSTPRAEVIRDHSRHRWTRSTRLSNPGADYHLPARRS